MYVSCLDDVRCDVSCVLITSAFTHISEVLLLYYPHLLTTHGVSVLITSLYSMGNQIAGSWKSYQTQACVPISH